MRLLLTLLTLMVFSSTVVRAQYSTTGSASPMAGCNQFEITPNANTQTGSMYSNTQIDLTTNWSLLFEVTFGQDNFGGEGMAFVLQAGAWTTGAGDYGLGYQGLANTLAVEFDTRDNQGSGQINNWDIAGDHISLMQNGTIDHSSADCLTGLPLDPISTLTGDVEDGVSHLVEIIWTAGATQTIEIKVDGATSLTHSSDMITSALAGNTMVTWGWTGATSIFSNQQLVGIALSPDFTFSATNCPGQVINFTDNTQSQNAITQYDWDFDGTVVTNGGPTPSHTFVTAGSHPVTLTVTDAAGCTADTTIDIGVGFDVNVSADDVLICPNTGTGLHADGVPYVGGTCCFELHCYDIWSDGWGGTEIEVFVDGTSAGTYAPPDLGGGGNHTEIFNFCWTNGANIELVVNGTPGIQPQESSVFLVDQNNDTIAQIESDFISGGTTWFDGASTTYTVDCGVPPPAYTYSWDNAGLLDNASSSDPNILSLPSSTTFTVDVTDPNTGCVIQESILVETIPTGTIDISGTDQVCQGDNGDLTVTLTGPTPYDFTVSGPGGPYTIAGVMSSPYTFSASQDGTYTITAFTSNGCNGTIGGGSGDINVIVPPAVDIEADATYCEGETIADLTVVSTNGGNVTWYDDAGLTNTVGTGNTYTPGALSVGTHQFYATEAETVLGCVGPSDMVTITVNQVPIAPSWTGQTTYCEGDFASPITATPELGGSMTWYDDAGLTNVVSTFANYAPPLNVGTTTYYVTETANGCEGPATAIPFTVYPTPTPPVVNGDTAYCEGELPTALTATPSIGGQIDWYNTLGINLGSGTSYTPGLTVGTTEIWVFETLNGCTSDSSIVTITVDPAPTVNVPDSVEICLGDSIQVTAANNGYAISWSDGQTGETVYLQEDTTTLITVVATNPACGFAEDSILLIVNDPPDITAGSDTLIGIGGEVTLWAESDNNVTYSWSPEVEECVTANCSDVYDVPDQATVYVVTATDNNGCTYSDTVLVDINGFMDVFVPNIFSPNGDGYNDLLEIKGPRLFNYSIEIYDRWGKRVFTSDEMKDFWDGTINGTELAPQTFVYMLSGETVLGERVVKEGNVSIIK